jgi:hypothetical protein
LIDFLNSSSCFHLVDFALNLIISCHLHLLGEFPSFFFRAFRCVVKLPVCALSSFISEELRAMSFPLRNAFILSHNMGYVVASFSLNSKKSLISFFMPSLTKVSLRRVLFSFHVNVGFLLFIHIYFFFYFFIFIRFFFIYISNATPFPLKKIPYLLSPHPAPQPTQSCFLALALPCTEA